MNRSDILVGAKACKVSNNLPSCNPPKDRKRFESLLTLLDGQHIGQSSL